jgi:hypothetical protein
MLNRLALLAVMVALFGSGCDGAQTVFGDGSASDLQSTADAVVDMPASDTGSDVTMRDAQSADHGAVELNRGWIGGACQSAADCSDPALVNPICETKSAFAGGFCTQVCSGKFCPDTDYKTTLATASRCIDAAGQPRCVAECDFAKSPTGCRPGYHCVQLPRYSEPASSFPVCLPEGHASWPGIPTPPNLGNQPLGAGCVNDSECSDGGCLRIQGGMCTRLDCKASGCPSGSSCYTIFADGKIHHACFKDCQSSGNCRTQEGYGCHQSRKVCWPPTTPSWDASVGPTDCKDAWGTAGSGLSRCDTVKDNYVVIRKSARNLAVCRAGTHVKSYHVGLGFAAIGDKVQSGDGKTPEGVFYISNMVPGTRFYKAFLLSYPDKADAARGLAAGWISASQKAAIDTAIDTCGAPPSNTQLGGLIEIHGFGGGIDWTHGCIALENNEVDEIDVSLAPLDSVVILP